MSQAAAPSSASRATSRRPTRQSRAYDKQERLLAAAERQVAEKGFEAVRMADIVAEAGCAIGTAYYLFGNKDGLFDALRDRYVERTRARMAKRLTQEGPAVDGTPEELIEIIVRSSVAEVVRSEGLLRAALTRSLNAPDNWNEFKGLVQLMQSRLSDGLSARFAREGVNTPPLKVSFALQLIFSTCFNALLNDPGPLHLTDEAFADELVAVTKAYLLTSAA